MSDFHTGSYTVSLNRFGSDGGSGRDVVVVWLWDGGARFQIRRAGRAGGAPEGGVALPALYAFFPARSRQCPRRKLRKQPVVTRDDLFELPVRLNGCLALECAPGRSVADTAAHEARAARGLPRDAGRGNLSLDG
ncbi:hypothetical protein GCM10027162_08050 [Streptomyces incanus]